MIRLALFLALALSLACGSPVEPTDGLCTPTQSVGMFAPDGSPAPVAVSLTYCPR